MRAWCGIGLIAIATLALGPAAAQERGDPIGPLAKIATFDRAHKVDVGKTNAGKIACYYREQGSSHTLDIGVAGDGAFIRLESGDQRDTTPASPVIVFAGKQIGRGGKDEFQVLRQYLGGIRYFVPYRERGGFILLARGEAKAFLEMVARARTEFVVVQSAADPAKTDIVAIYDFTTASIPALLSCAKARLQ